MDADRHLRRAGIAALAVLLYALLLWRMPLSSPWLAPALLPLFAACLYGGYHLLAWLRGELTAR